MSRRYPCDYCGKVRPTEQLIRSRFTRQRYCAIDLRACEHRAKRRKQKREAVLA